jgi:hypothetical protein
MAGHLAIRDAAGNRAFQRGTEVPAPVAKNGGARPCLLKE